ncbi:MAG: HPr kinase/phosphatase C-terminal domain-containing protein [Gluconacetobacter diazotrophicus]|nr:HPr kinase/phosphatase C-terminal domain-containing protein [Gluconacetobacter diazotrophicus]
MQPETGNRGGRVTLHGTCVTRGEDALLLLGAPGSGKSDLALRLLDRGFELVADDRIVMEDGLARPPATLAGLIEVRGLGVLRLPHRAPVRPVLILRLDGEAVRLPGPAMPHPFLRLPVLDLDPRPPSAAAKAEWALDAVVGRRQVATGFLPLRIGDDDLPGP